MIKKHLFLILIVICLNVSPALADNTTVDPYANTIRLPGNAYIVTNDDEGPRGVIIKNNNSVWYRAVVAPYAGPKDLYVPQRAPMGFIDSTCGGITSINEKNKCIGDAIREQEKLRERYN